MTLKKNYCLFNAELQTFQLHKSWWWAKKPFAEPLSFQLPTLNLNELQDFLHQELREELISLKANEPFFQQFWQLADLELYTHLLLSVYLRKIHQRGVFNIKTSNWLDKPEFKKIYRDNKNYFSSWRPRQILSRYIRTAGDHRRNLRFGQIHLAYDRRDGQDFYSIHYDRYNPNQFKKLGLLKHFLLEDSKNKKLI